MKKFVGFERGMGIGGWLTNYKRFNVLPDEYRLMLTVGDMEHFRSFITERDVKYIASLEMDHIRLSFDQLVIEEKPCQYREEILQLIDNMILWCEASGLHIVLNLHKAIGNYCDIDEKRQLLNDEILQQRFISLWVMLEKRYHNKNEIAFELLNEVRNVDPEQWNDLAYRAVKAIRELNPTRKIILGSTCWNRAHMLLKLRVDETDENLIYTFHMYDPMEFTHQKGVLNWTNCFYNRDMPYPCDDIERYRTYHRLLGHDSVYSDLNRMDAGFIRQNLHPVEIFMQEHPEAVLWCGEFGTIRHADIVWRENYMRDVIAFLKDHNISYCVWNYLSTPNDGNRFSLVDDDNRRILSKRMERIIRGDLSEQ